MTYTSDTAVGHGDINENAMRLLDSSSLRRCILHLLICILALAAPRAAGDTVINVLLVYDITAATWVATHGGMAQFSANAIGKMNMALNNSTTGDLTFRLAHAASVNYVRTDLDSDLNRLTLGTDTLAEVHTLRDDYRADVVAMLVDTGTAFGTVGKGWELSTLNGQPDHAFTVCAIQAVHLGHVLTHEVGHILGCDHANSQAKDPGPNLALNTYSAGWYFVVGYSSPKMYHTIMAYDDPYGDGSVVATPAPLFSSPLIAWEGVVAGDPDNGDNARNIRETMAVVANYRSDPGQPTIDALEASPNPVQQNAVFTLTATGVNDEDGNVTRVEFFRDTNENGRLDISGDELIGAGTQSGNTWRLAKIASFPIGDHRYFARARDNVGTWSGPKSCVGTICSPAPNSGSYVAIAADGLEWDDTHGTGNSDGVTETHETITHAVVLHTDVKIGDLTATVLSTDRRVTFARSTVHYPPVAANSDVWPFGNGFTMTIDTLSTAVIPFTLYVEYTYNDRLYSQTFAYNHTFYAPGSRKASLAVTSYVVSDPTSLRAYNNGDGNIDSGEVVDIRPVLSNTGSAKATGISAWFTYAGSGFAVDPSDREAFPDLSPGDKAPPSGTGRFRIADLALNYAGNATLDLHLRYDQAEEEVVVPEALSLNVLPAAWLRVQPKTADFGIVSPNSSLTSTTLVQNLGAKALQITDVAVSSPDTSWAGFSLPCTLQPGQTAKLVLKTMTTGLQGRITRSVKVTSSGRVRYPGEDDTFTVAGVVSDNTPVYAVPGVVSANSPDISGDWIVWDDYRNGNSDIYAFNTATLEERAICVDPAAQYSPFISGGLIAWNDRRNGPTNLNTDIYGYDLNRPDIGVFVIVTNGCASSLMGVDGNLIAVATDYYVFAERTSWYSARNAVVYRYLGSGRVIQEWTSGFVANSDHLPMESVDEDGDFANGLLVVPRQQLFWKSYASGARWDSRDQRLQVVNFATGGNALRDAVTGWNNWPRAAKSQFIYVDSDDNGDDQIFAWLEPGSVVQVTSAADFDYGDDALGLGGPDGTEAIVYDYGQSTRPGLYYRDGVDGVERVISTTVDPEDLRMDGYRLVFKERLSGVLKYSYLKQPDVEVSPIGITFSPGDVVEGGVVSVSVVVRNLSAYDQPGRITVHLYDGDPTVGSTPLASSQYIDGLASRSERTVMFPNIVQLVEGAHDICAALTVDGSDLVGNNKAFRVLVVRDSDEAPPVLTAFRVLEDHGDGDGIIGTDETAQIEFTARDASGIAAVHVLLDGSERPVTGGPDKWMASLGTSSAGTHSIEVRLTDADTSPLSSTNIGELKVVLAEHLAVLLGGVRVTGQPNERVALTSSSASEPPSAKFAIRNEGQQSLVIESVDCAGPFIAAGPGASYLNPSASTSLEIYLSTAVPGTYEGVVTIVSSDAKASPLSFHVIANNAHGRVKWRFDMGRGAGGWGAPALDAAGNVYVGGAFAGTNLFAVRPDGGLRWSRDTGGAIWSDLTVGPDGSIYVGNINPKGGLSKYSSEGVLQWLYPDVDRVDSGASIDRNGNLLFGSESGGFTCVNSSGERLWNVDTRGAVRGPAAVAADGTVYFGSYSSNFWTRSGDGSRQIKAQTDGSVRGAPAILDDGTVVVGDFAGFLYAFHPDGSLRWKVQTGGRIYASAVQGLDGSIVVPIGDPACEVAAFDRDGSKRWAFPVGRWDYKPTDDFKPGVYCTPAVGADGTVFFGSYDTNFYAIKASGTNVALAWKLAADHVMVASPSIAPDGTVYFMTSRGTLYAVATECGGLADTAWPKFKRDLGNTGLCPGNGSVLAHWSLDGSANDAGANQIESELVGTKRIVPGRVGTALHLDGNSFITVSNAVQLNREGFLTIAAWIRLPESSGMQNIIAHGHTRAPDAEVFLRIWDGRYEVGSWDGETGNTGRAAAQVLPGQVDRWVHLAGVYDGAQWLLYTNGVLAASKATAKGAVLVDAPWAIGARGGGGERFFKGAIDDVWLIGRALSPSQICALPGDPTQQRPMLGVWNYTSPLSLSISGSPGQRFSIEGAADLKPPVSWQPVDEVTLADPSQLWPIPAATQAAQYFRVRETAP